VSNINTLKHIVKCKVEGKKMFNKSEGSDHVKKPRGRYKRKVVKTLLIVVPILVLVGIVAGYAYNAGFIPITGFMDVKAPYGDSVELDVSTYIDEYPEFEDIPNLDKIKHSAYGTDESVNTVVSNYKQQLQGEGYSVKYEGTMDFEGRQFRVVGFLKGLTAVGVVVTDDADDEFGYDTVVLYATGSAFDFQEILEWYQNN
jgi:hypothetical protein